GALHPGQVLVGFELVAGGGEGFRGRAGHAHRDDIAAQAAAALREGDVVGVAGDDHHVGEVRHEVEVLDGVDGQADVGAVLRIGRGGEQLHEVHGAGDELAAVDRVDRGGPVGVGAGEHEGAEGGGVVDDGAHVHGGLREALGDLR